MPLDFPISPTDGQTYNGYVYSTSVGAWQAKPNAQSPFYTRDTPPSNPVAGDSWFNTNDGTLYVYYYDGNTYQWVEHRSQIAKSQVGLVPVSPTSVTVGSGTGTIDSSGLVTISGATSVSIDGIFSSAYKNYKIILDPQVTTTASGYFARFRTGGATNSSSNYNSWGFYYDYNSGAFDSGFRVVAGTNMALNYAYASRLPQSMDIFAPYVADATYMRGIKLSASTMWDYTGNYNAATSFDGIYFSFPNAATGTFKVYGYN